MAELADAHGSGPCESNFMQVQVLSSAPVRVFIWTLGFFICKCRYEHPHYVAASFISLAAIFLQKSPARSFRSFFSAKGHACFGYLLVNALTTPLLRYQPFADAPAALGELSNPIIPLRPKHSNQNLLPIGETFGFVVFLKKLNKSLFVAVWEASYVLPSFFQYKIERTF